jgi:uncharacterized membrane protein
MDFTERYSQRRLVVVDFARVLAILFMVQGHALDVLLHPVYRQGAMFKSWLFLRGLTAPMFFTLSGISFALSSMRRWDLYSRLTPKLLKRTRRFAFFILLGYAMHLPVKSFHDFRYLDAAGWQGWLQVDVLQCIGVTLIFLQFLVLAAGTRERFAKLAAATGAFAVLAAPIAWRANEIKFLPLSLVSFISGRTGSLFPLFPWSGYVLLGGALGYLAEKMMRERENLDFHLVKPVALTGAGMILGGIAVALIPFSPYGNIDFWTISPGVFLLKGGSVLLLLTALFGVTQHVSIPEQTARSIAQESLLVYFVHVCILYGCIWHDGLRQSIGASLPPLPTIGWIAALVASMLLLAWTWNWYKRTQPTSGLLVRTTAFALAIAYGLK